MSILVRPDVIFRLLFYITATYDVFTTSNMVLFAMAKDVKLSSDWVSKIKPLSPTK